MFANIKYGKGLNRFTLRGKIKVNIQWTLYCRVHNIGKLPEFWLCIERANGPRAKETSCSQHPQNDHSTKAITRKLPRKPQRTGLGQERFVIYKPFSTLSADSVPSFSRMMALIDHSFTVFFYYTPDVLAYPMRGVCIRFPSVVLSLKSKGNAQRNLDRLCATAIFSGRGHSLLHP